jgi:hypothetical protein
MIVGLVVTGIVGYPFIDNAGHAGGLVAGVLAGFVVRDLSGSPIHERSRESPGRLALLILVLGRVDGRAADRLARPLHHGDAPGGVRQRRATYPAAHRC